MSWSGRLFAPELSDSTIPNHGTLPEKVDSLIRYQTTSWPMLSHGYGGLEQIKTKRLENPYTLGSFVIVQHNPARIRSTAASVDQASIQSRKCFLCPENLPAEEMGLEYGKEFIIACNPYPVLDRHLSIIHRRHIEQRIAGHEATLLALARDLGPGYMVLYNGPRCGASAPDHLHLQACSPGQLPVEASLGRLKVIDIRGADSDPYQGIVVGILEDFGRSVIVVRGRAAQNISRTIARLLANFARTTAAAGAAATPVEQIPAATDDSEPMINIISTHGGGLWTVYLFPRARHRPASFFAEGDDRITVSPGAIDMAGVLVVPREEDFARIGAEQAIAIFSEVSASPSVARELAESL
jgi:hypothetical protein